MPVNSIGGHITLILPDPDQRAASFHALADCGGRVIRSFASAEDYLESEKDVAGGVALLHWTQPGDICGRSLLGAIAARGDLEALVVADRLSLAESRDIMHMGARDLVPAPIESALLQQIVDNALAAWTDAQIFLQARRDAYERLDRLTPREHDILDAMAEGLASKEIARRYDLSPRTVEVHRANIMRRSESRSFAELMRLKFLIEIGLSPQSYGASARAPVTPDVASRHSDRVSRSSSNKRYERCAAPFSPLFRFATITPPMGRKL
jgi:two-component system, LuxR family, response regulator FixJ